MKYHVYDDFLAFAIILDHFDKHDEVPLYAFKLQKTIFFFDTRWLSTILSKKGAGSVSPTFCDETLMMLAAPITDDCFWRLALQAR